MTCALLLHANAQAGEILIDNFSTDQGPITDTVVGVEAGSQTFNGGTVTVYNTNYSQVSGGGILGGYRDIYVEEIANDNERDRALLGLTATVSDDTFSVDLDSGVKGFAVVTYDGSNEVGSDWEFGVDTDGLGGVDWSGTTEFSFEDVTNDGVAPVQLIVWTDDENNGTFVKHTLEYSTLDIDGEYDATISVSGFDGGPINWASVGAFQAVFNLDSTQNPDNSTISVDLSLGRALAVPEPAALSMFGAGLLVLGAVGARRRKTSVTHEYSAQ